MKHYMSPTCGLLYYREIKDVIKRKHSFLVFCNHMGWLSSKSSPNDLTSC